MRWLLLAPGAALLCVSGTLIVERSGILQGFLSSAEAEQATSARPVTADGGLGGEADEPQPTSGAFDPETIRMQVGPRIDAGQTDLIGQTIEAYAKAADDARLDYKAQRTVFDLFAVSSPDVDKMTAGWLKKEPASPYALTARGWYLWHMGWLMRGEDFTSSTYPEAITQAQALFAEAASDAEKALAAMPDLLGASDLLILSAMHTPTKQTVPEIVDQVMKLKPNRHTLINAAAALGPKWLGQGKIDQILALCHQHAAEVPDVVGYSVDVCKADLLYRADVAPDQLSAASAGFAASKSWVLVKPDARRVLATRDHSADAQRALELYLFDPRVADTEAAQYLDGGFYMDQKRPLVSFDVFSRKVAQATDRLQRDPMNRKLIDDASIELPPVMGQNRRVLPGTMPQAARFAAFRTALKGAPFDPQLWVDLARSAPGDTKVGAKAYEAFLRNAIAYSNQTAFFAGTYANDLAMTGTMTEEGLDAEEQCDFVRAVRIYAVQCPFGVDGSAACGQSFDLDTWKASLSGMQGDGSCAAIASEDLADAAFKPEKINWAAFGK